MANAGSARAPSGALALLLVLAVVLGVWLLHGSDPGTPTSSPGDGTRRGRRSPTCRSPADRRPRRPVHDRAGDARRRPARCPTIDEFSGLPFVVLADLPPEAQDTVDLIDADGPFPYDQDGGTFGNLEGLLPDFEDGYYPEYTVETPGSPDRGARRIIAGADGELYWTDDHYESFARSTLTGEPAAGTT